MAKKSVEHYDNNPFTIATNGLATVFNTARGVFFLFLVLSLAQFNSSPQSSREELDKQVDSIKHTVTHTVSGWTTTEWTMAIGTAAIILLAVAMITALFGGISSYTSAQLAKGRKVSIGEAFRVAFERLWSYLWLRILVTVKILLWSLLFIIPGIIMSIRYSLAGAAFFDDDKHLRGNAAIKESIRLTKNAWITTYASLILFNLITFSVISSLVNIGVVATLYRQYQSVGDKKPQAHALSWIALALPFILFVLAAVFFIVAFAILRAFVSS